MESALIEHEAVKESAVVPSPDVTRGQVVKAYVVLSDKYKHVIGVETEENALKGWREIIFHILISFYMSEELQNYVKNTTAPYKYPRKIEFVEGLPKTVSGKIRRTELRMKELKD